MKITLTIEIDDNNKEVKVNSAPVTQEPESVNIEAIPLDVTNYIIGNNTPIAPCIEEMSKTIDNLSDKPKIKIDETSFKGVIGEKLSKGYHSNNKYMIEGRTEEYPYNVLDAKALLMKYKIKYTELAKELGNYDVVKLRNLFRIDGRRFTEKDFNAIISAIHNVLITRSENNI